MVRAFGYCNDSLDTQNPGRLCRGRERWLEGIPETPGARVARTVVSGAQFSDDSARDALRGFHHAGVPAGALLSALFPKSKVLAFAHRGDPLALPEKMLVEEDWMMPTQGGVTSRPAVRWVAEASAAELDLWLAGEKDGVAAPKAEGFLVVKSATVPEGLLDALYQLNGFADDSSAPALLYAPTALPAVLEHVKAVVLFHLDKHGPGLAIYTLEPLDSLEALRKVAKDAGTFPVPFAIPPMLARWDRALYELRLDWDAEANGEFPVPPADDAGGRWSARSRRIGNERDDEPTQETNEGGEE